MTEGEKQKQGKREEEGAEREREREKANIILQRRNLRVARTNDHRTIAAEFPLVANLSDCGMVELGPDWHSETTR